MTDHVCSDGGEYALRRLQDELAKRGLKSELNTRAAVPRLRVFGHGELHDAIDEFQNTIVACCFGHDGWYAWPWAEPIARVSQVAKAADEILDALGARDDDSLR